MPFEDPRPDGLHRLGWICAGLAILAGVLILLCCALAIHARAAPSPLRSSRAGHAAAAKVVPGIAVVKRTTP
jgi:hypothetical protein